MYTQKQMRRARYEADIINRIQKRLPKDERKKGFVTHFHCGCGDPDAIFLYLEGENEQKTHRMS